MERNESKRYAKERAKPSVRAGRAWGRPRGENGRCGSSGPERHRSGGLSRSVKFSTCMRQKFRRAYVGERRQALFLSSKNKAATLRRWQRGQRGTAPRLPSGSAGGGTRFRSALSAARRWALLQLGAAPALPALALSSAVDLTRHFNDFPLTKKRPSHKRRLPRVTLHGRVKSFCSKTFLCRFFFFFFF